MYNVKPLCCTYMLYNVKVHLDWASAYATYVNHAYL